MIDVNDVNRTKIKVLDLYFNIFYNNYGEKMILNPLCILRSKGNIYFLLDYNNQSLLKINKRCFSILKLFENNCIAPEFTCIQLLKGLKTLRKKEFDEFLQYCLDSKLILHDEEYEIYRNKRKNITNES